MGAEAMRQFRGLLMSALLALAATLAMAGPSRADTGTVRILFGAAGAIVGVGNGTGTLTFQGRDYQFVISGASIGATLALTIGELDGRASNLRAPGDLAGTYVAVGIGGAIAGGAGIARLRNAKGVLVVLHGPRLGAGVSISLARVTITMM
jgi:hypothetical protein